MAVQMEMIPEDDFPDNYADSVGEGGDYLFEDEEEENNPPWVILNHNWGLLPARRRIYFLLKAIFAPRDFAMQLAWQSRDTG